jgi:hypothetical protein
VTRIGLSGRYPEVRWPGDSIGYLLDVCCVQKLWAASPQQEQNEGKVARLLGTGLNRNK